MPPWLQLISFLSVLLAGSSVVVNIHNAMESDSDNSTVAIHQAQSKLNIFSASSRQSQNLARRQMYDTLDMDARYPRLRQRPPRAAAINTTLIWEHCEYHKQAAGVYKGSKSCLEYLDQAEVNYTYIDMRFHKSRLQAPDSTPRRELAASVTGASKLFAYAASQRKLAKQAHAVTPRGLASGEDVQPELFPASHHPSLFHMFWNGPFKDIMLLTVDSFIFSQPDYHHAYKGGDAQHLARVELCIWISHPSLSSEPINGSYDVSVSELIAAGMKIPDRILSCPGLIRFKRWNLATLVSSLPSHVFPDDVVAAVKLLNQESQFPKIIEDVLRHHSSSNPVQSSDWVRFVLLNLYGGLYIDSDVLLLRDMRPLMGHTEWFYRWEDQDFCNTALLHLHKGSQKANTIMKAGLSRALKVEITQNIVTNETEPAHITMTDDWSNTFHPSQVCPDAVINADGAPIIYPSQLFDPAWLRGMGAEKGFEWKMPSIMDWSEVNPTASLPNITFLDYFPGAFANHWHNQWDAPIRVGAWTHIFRTAYDAFLMRRGVNIYGEQYVPERFCEVAI